MVLSRLFTKNSCVVVAFEVSYYRITYRITVLLYYWFARYSLLWLVTACYGCYRLLPLVIARYHVLLCYVLNDYYTISRTGEYRGYGIVGQLLVDLVVAVGRSG